MRYIELTRGYRAKVDDEDFECLSKHSWCATFRKNGTVGYAVRGVTVAPYKTKLLPMHRAIMKTPDGFDTDHINGDRLDNRKCNLRVATRTQNSINVVAANKNNLVGLRGVQMTPKGRYYCGIKINGKRKHLGMFDDPLEAHAAYVKAKLKAYQEFTPLVFR